MLNIVTIMGRMVRDPELRRTGSGIAVASFTLAVEDDFKDKDGNRKTIFVDCTAWRNTGEFVSKYFTKGRMAVVSGKLDIREWTDKDGSKRKAAEVVADNVYFADSKKDAENSGSRPAAAPAGNPAAFVGNPAAPAGYSVPPYSNNNYAQLDDDEELPF